MSEPITQAVQSKAPGASPESPTLLLPKQERTGALLPQSNANKSQIKEIENAIELLDADKANVREKASRVLTAKPENLGILLKALADKSLSAEQLDGLSKIISSYLPTSKNQAELNQISETLQLDFDGRDIANAIIHAVHGDKGKGVSQLFEQSQATVARARFILACDQAISRQGITLLNCGDSEQRSLELAGQSKNQAVQDWALPHLEYVPLREFMRSSLNDLARESPRGAERLMQAYFKMTHGQALQSSNSLLKKLEQKISAEAPDIAYRCTAENSEAQHYDTYANLHLLEQQAQLITEGDKNISAVWKALAEKYTSAMDTQAPGKLKDVESRSQLYRRHLALQTMAYETLNGMWSAKCGKFLSVIDQRILNGSPESAKQLIDAFRDAEQRAMHVDIGRSLIGNAKLPQIFGTPSQALDRQVEKIALKLLTKEERAQLDDKH